MLVPGKGGARRQIRISTVLDEVYQALWCADCDAGAVLFEEGDLLLKLEVFGELQMACQLLS